MIFNSLDFLIFFPIVLIIHLLIPNKYKYLWLLAASYYFYMCWNIKYAFLMLFSTIITYTSGLLLEKAGAYHTTRKKIITALSFLLNLGILFYYKYFNFGVELLQQFCNNFGIKINLPVFDIILPVGISFYTFQALSYTMDVYRGSVSTEKNFFRYALFVSFFPNLLAGPIERSKIWLKIQDLSKPFDYNSAKEGFLFMLYGFFLKLVIADRISIFVDNIYSNYEDFPGWYLITATFLFAIQIYCDFCGYSSIAYGSAKILGIQLSKNFDAPYISTSIANFWHRWHISLTEWFTDYLYFPLGGNRKGRFRKYFNKILVFLISGLWHGANLSFVVWGLLNGFLLVVEEIIQPMKIKFLNFFHKNGNSFAHNLFNGIITFVLIDFTWIFFRAEDLTTARNIIKSIFQLSNFWIFYDKSIYNCGLDKSNFLVLMISIGLLLFVDICKREGVALEKEILKQDYWFRCLVIVSAIALILIFGIWGPNYNAGNFIYLQF